MRKNLFVVVVLAVLMFGFTFGAPAQRKTKLGKVCGNPNLPCKKSDDFRPFEMPFNMGRGLMVDSEPFYAVILKSVKTRRGEDCKNAFSEDERRETQKLFPNNKVFGLICDSPVALYYTNVSGNTTFLSVFAGKTLVEANKFLRIVRATKKFQQLSLRRMQARFNGT